MGTIGLWLVPGLACTRAEPHAADASVPTRRPSAAASATPSAAASATPSAAMTHETAEHEPASLGDDEADSRQARPCQLLAVGDSLTDTRSAGGGYLEAVRRHCDCRITNLGKGGAMVNQIRAQLLAHLAEGGAKYSDIVVFGGVNDLYSDLTAHRTVAKIESDLSTMYDAAHHHGARVIAFTVTPWGGFKRYFTDARWQSTLTLNEWIRQAKARATVDYLVDGERLLSCGTPTLLCPSAASPHRDGLHFGPAGHRLLGAALVKALGPKRCHDVPDAGSGVD
ncbi:MAG TPA: SGNH/GDSL hydrolase family protein [Polyangiaceae bacterium]